MNNFRADSYYNDYRGKFSRIFGSVLSINEIFIHYGNTEISSSKFNKIKNRLLRDKPHGGFWGSPIASKFGWKEWCDQEEFRECEVKNSVKFIIKEDANILIIDCYEDLDQLPIIPQHHKFSYYDMDVDFEKIRGLGCDAIYLTEKGNGEVHLSHPKSLNSWDCESILIMNINSIMQING